MTEEFLFLNLFSFEMRVSYLYIENTLAKKGNNIWAFLII